MNLLKWLWNDFKTRVIYNKCGASVTNSFTNGTTADADEVNQNFTDLVSEFDTTTGHDHDGTDSKTITTLGTISSGVWQGTAVGTQYGGTGQNFSTEAQGEILYFSAAGVLSSLAVGASGRVLTCQGASANPIWGLPTGLELFTSTGTFTAPVGVTKVFVTMVGGGGGGHGGTLNTNAGGGGGAGAYIIQAHCDVVAESGYTVTVGAKGTGSVTGSSPTNGGASSFAGASWTITCNGGSGGGGPTGGAGGTSSGSATGTTNTNNVAVAGGVLSTIAGADGGAGDDGDDAGGGGGAGSFWGAGGNGAGADAVGGDSTAGSGFGTGGGGGSSETAEVGKDGTAGFVLVQWGS